MKNYDAVSIGVEQRLVEAADMVVRVRESERVGLRRFVGAIEMELARLPRGTPSPWAQVPAYATMTSEFAEN
ncbi:MULTISPECIES: hypothetical protein [unclassified Bradyrhizobium]|uniref:hypothetical protein n=1 Tax=unclassified Bradyrhizobium TaxID=2631580 RepID=UPI001FF78600|nr:MULTISPECIES: hypothetical protein [unclassified Bradyrhizobium]